MERLLRILLLALAALLLPACATHKPSPTPANLRLYAFDCGTIDVADISVFQPGIGKNKHKRLTDSCYLISHAKGTLIWDTGLSDGLAQSPQGMKVFNGLFTMHVTHTLTSQLKEIGVDPASITYLGISHMHGDHIGNVALFPKATLLMQKEEYAAAFGPTPEKFGFDPKNYSSLKGNPVKQLDGDYDVFGDGSVMIKRALGHTPGHQALFVKLARSGNILLSGDLVHYTDNWEHKRVPSFNFDKAQSVKTMQETEKFLQANHAQLWIQHDLEQNAKIRHAPAYYD